MLSPVLITPAAGPVVSLEEAKRHCRIEPDVSEEDELVAAFVSAATSHLEKTLSLSLLSQRWRQDFSGFETLRLPFKPVDVDSITIDYYDTDGSSQTADPSTYRVLTDAEGTYIEIVSGESWPSVDSRPDAVSVEFDAGYAAEDIPAGLKVAICLHTAFLYENRESHTETAVTPTGAYEMFVWPFKAPGV